MKQVPPHALVRHVRIFISSPRDVAKERDLARSVVERLELDPAFRTRLKLDAILYDDPVVPVPMLAGSTPQEAVNRQLPASACDIVVCMFWGRMGSPPIRPLRPDNTPYLSGTEAEFDDARRAGRDILLYRCTAKIPADLDDPELEAKRVQKQLVDQFFERLDGLGYSTYERPEQFEKLLESNLRAILHTFLPAHDPQSDDDPVLVDNCAPLTIPVPYREWLKSETGSLALFGLGSSLGRPLFLSSVYVPLVTSASEESLGRSYAVPQSDETSEHPLLLLQALERQSLYVPGSPGSGKSTFCNWVVWLACEGAMPNADIDPPRNFVEAFPRPLAGKLPVLVRLREFWQALPRTVPGGALSEKDFVAVLGSWLRERTATAAGLDLMAFAKRGSMLLVLDGIDEVPTALASDGDECNPRQVLLLTLASIVKQWAQKGNVFMITSRPYGLADTEVRNLGLRSAPIAGLPKTIQSLLARRWFRIQTQDQDKGDRSADDVMRDIDAREWVQPLAANPLMLTAMCAIYGDGGRLPQDRHQLYDRVIDTVLTRRYSDTRRRDRARFELGAVAYAMHTGEGLGSRHAEPMTHATFDEAELALRQDQSAATQRASVLGPKQAREDLLTRSGLLTARGQKQVGFYHLSIQEFLCAERIFELRLDALKDVFLRYSTNATWRNTLSFLFARHMAAFSVPTRSLGLLRDLIEDPAAESVGLQLVLGDCVEMLGAKGYPLDDAPQDRLRELLLASMTRVSSAKTRCEAGKSLGKIGDPRFDEGRWSLPREEPLGFVRIEAGPFVMGSDLRASDISLPHERPQHSVELGEFYIGRYPVTVAQFNAFLRDSGYGVPDAAAVRDTANHPIDQMTWHDAIAYCEWLTDKLRDWTDVPHALREWFEATIRNGWRVTLPSEAEWEKAARGNDGREYPWGPAFDPDCVNAFEASIGMKSAVGAFPRGASPHGALDMSGNVWEWTRSVWSNNNSDARSFGYPYRLDDPSREDLRAPDVAPRVLRGGSANLSFAFVRPALRYWELPTVRQKDFGFRVALCPPRS